MVCVDKQASNALFTYELKGLVKAIWNIASTTVAAMAAIRAFATATALMAS
jgi:hypothetical protein